ncbi:UPF0676 protein C1494.01-like [Acanthaster planci]|uniref:UPF0676 protein C1494.01-like n=1 Tax=Acanthaster planci TaxID=133434 RepID=A0A8B7XZS3_ACAPL|nr:UPF0676 protein C1494.01-like [Acanthaster planci]XP_022085763.1 UPF0676 protein C1494.01-like [Acanthaster planci]XP_022085764.1 UPF0676 protein C1494.01-like [Acanthaster planci]XP_022085765.1 UPF0676 protein C1494.01-like [Acanthaster planci]
MGDSSSEIPVIDFSAYRLSLDKPDPSQFQKLVDDVHNALTTIGFFFIVNTDFPQDKVEELYKVSKQYFDLPLEVKLQCPRPQGSAHGYVKVDNECTNPDRPHGDLKENFNYCPQTAGAAWPLESDCPGFKTAMCDFFDLCLPLCHRILEIMAHGLKLEDPLYFVKHHQKAGKDSAMTLRTLYYPPLSSFKVKEQQVRCGEHSDFGSVTLLFQQTPGLLVRNIDGSYIKVPMVEAGILINTGSLMARWTSDMYPATKHCVFMDNTPEEMEKSRQSIAFFGYPDNDAIIECVDKSNKYPPMSALNYLKFRLNQLYHTPQS